MHPFGPEDIVATAEALGISMTDTKILVESFLMAQNRAKSLDFEGVYRQGRDENGEGIQEIFDMIELFEDYGMAVYISDEEDGEEGWVMPKPEAFLED